MIHYMMIFMSVILLIHVLTFALHTDILYSLCRNSLWFGSEWKSTTCTIWQWQFHCHWSCFSKQKKKPCMTYVLFIVFAHEACIHFWLRHTFFHMRWTSWQNFCHGQGDNLLLMLEVMYRDCKLRYLSSAQLNSTQLSISCLPCLYSLQSLQHSIQFTTLKLYAFLWRKQSNRWPAHLRMSKAKRFLISVYVLHHSDNEKYGFHMWCWWHWIQVGVIREDSMTKYIRGGCRIMVMRMDNLEAGSQNPLLASLMGCIIMISR